MVLKQIIIYICKIANAVIAAIGTTDHSHDVVEDTSHPIVISAKRNKYKNNNKQKQDYSSRDPPKDSDPFAPFAPAVAGVIIAQGRPIHPQQTVEYRIPITEFSDIAPFVSNVIVSGCTPLDFDEQKPYVIGMALPSSFKFPKAQEGYWKPEEPMDPTSASPLSTLLATTVKPAMITASKEVEVLVAQFKVMNGNEESDPILGMAILPSFEMPKVQEGFWKPEEPMDPTSASPLSSLLAIAFKPVMLTASNVAEVLVAQARIFGRNEESDSILGMAIPPSFKMPKVQEGFWTPEEPIVSGGIPLIPSIMLSPLAPFALAAPHVADILIASATPLEQGAASPPILGIAALPSVTLPKVQEGFWKPEEPIVSSGIPLIPSIILSPLAPFALAAPHVADILIAHAAPLHVNHTSPVIMGADPLDLTIWNETAEHCSLESLVAISGASTIIPFIDFPAFTPAIANIIIGTSTPLDPFEKSGVDLGYDIFEEPNLLSILAAKDLPVSFAAVDFFDHSDFVKDATMFMGAVPYFATRKIPEPRQDTFFYPDAPPKRDSIINIIAKIGLNFDSLKNDFLIPIAPVATHRIYPTKNSFFFVQDPALVVAAKPVPAPPPPSVVTAAAPTNPRAEAFVAVTESALIAASNEPPCPPPDYCCPLYECQAVAPVMVTKCVCKEDPPASTGWASFFNPYARKKPQQYEPEYVKVQRKRGRYSPFLPKRIDISHVEGWGAGIGYGTDYTTVAMLFATEYQLGHIMPMLDIRGHRFDNNTYAANVGIGGRFIPCPDSFCELLGFNFFYDYREGCQGHYNGIGFGIEVLGRRWEFRANAYAPFGIKKHEHVCVYDEFTGGFEAIRRDCEFATYGFNGEIGYLVVYDCPFYVYAGAGPYYLARTCSNYTIGGQIRVKPQYKDYVALELKLSCDPVFHTVFQAAIIFSLPLYQIYSRIDKTGPCCIEDWQIYQPIERFEVNPLGRKTCWQRNF